jgi:hypothetical protein
MPPRVDDAGVKTILDTSLDTTPFITVAHLLVEQHLANQGVSEDLLTELERWLAAHFACIRDPRFREARTAGEGMVFELGKPGEGLAATTYGQQALLLDPTGRLALVTTTKRASIKVN